MHSAQTKKALAATGSALLLATMGAAGIASATPLTASADDAAADEVRAGASAQSISESVVAGRFTWTQGEITPTSEIAKRFSGVVKHICGSAAVGGSGESVSAQNWPLAVKGEVDNALFTTLGELVNDESKAQLVMGCSCAGNPADGLASANAEVLGVKVSSILEAAEVKDGANTIVFTSADGYETALPLSYVKQRFSIIAYDINGEPVANSMGGSNQLWLGSTAASYFARDIVEITLEARQTPPPAPGSEAAEDRSENLPNVSVYESEMEA